MASNLKNFRRPLDSPNGADLHAVPNADRAFKILNRGWQSQLVWAMRRRPHAVSTFCFLLRHRNQMWAPHCGRCTYILELARRTYPHPVVLPNTFQSDSVSQVVLHSTHHGSEEDDIWSVRFMFRAEIEYDLRRRAVRLGNSDLNVSRIILGTMQYGNSLPLAALGPRGGGSPEAHQVRVRTCSVWCVPEHNADFCGQLRPRHHHLRHRVETRKRRLVSKNAITGLRRARRARPWLTGTPLRLRFINRYKNQATVDIVSR